MKKILMLMLTMIILAIPAGGVKRSEFAYSILMPKSYTKPTFVELDLTHNKIIKKHKVDRMANHLSINADGNVYISRYMGVGEIGNAVDLYYPANDKQKTIIKTRGDGPMTVVPYKDKLFVLMYAKYEKPPIKRRAAAFEVYKIKNGKYKFIKEIDFGDDSYVTSANIAIDKESGKAYVVTYQIIAFVTGNKPTIHEIDLEKMQITRQKVLEEFGAPNGLVVTKEGKIYIGSTYQNYSKKAQRKRLFSNYLSVYSVKGFKFLKKIKVGFLVKRIAYAPEDNKIYVARRKYQNKLPGITVIDVLNDKVIKKIPFGDFDRIEYAGSHKVLISGGDARDEEYGIYVIDTRKDRIINVFPGMLISISKNFSDL